MNTNTPTKLRPQLETLACVRLRIIRAKGQNSLSVHKTYGRDAIRYVHRDCYGAEFSERKRTALWKTKVTENQAIAVTDHLAEGCSLNLAPRK